MPDFKIDKDRLHEACKYIGKLYSNERPEKIEYDLKDSLIMIKHIGGKYCKRFNQKFVFSEYYQQHYSRILPYFFNDPTGSLDLTKGLFIIGTVGTGKTLTFRLVHQYFKSIQLGVPYESRSCIKIMEEYSEFGFASLIDYTKNVYYFDDLGVESPATRHFGTNLNVMAHIINRRYEYFEHTGQLTHFTSNLGKDEIRKIYGKRVLDRLNKMCNWIRIEKDSFRK